MTTFVHRYEPPAPNAADPSLTILALHGTGGNEHDLISFAQLIAPDASVISPRGQVDEYGAARFFRRHAEGVFDLEDLARRTDDLHAFVVESARHYRRDLTRTIAVGFSNGANVAASLLLRYPGVLGGALLYRAMVPFEPESPPPAPALRTRVTVVPGTLDPLVPEGDPERLVALLNGAGCDATLSWSPMAHALGPFDVRFGRELVATFAR